MLAETSSEDKKDVPFVIPRVHSPADTSHPNAIVGTTIMSKLFA